ncbi:GNAT family N-acetyltransferase [Streptomyces sp. URMC 123]|uniref:GNAT family N-acetyltransferase n=1 Tax=Streptomyces sp. URMC 123 TaxID=3423403 RepID=UPI003F1B35F6
MTTRSWPLYGLRITTPRLELCLPGPDLLDDLAVLAADGVHDPDSMPFIVPWSAASPEERARSTFQHVLGTVAQWRPERWTLSLAVSLKPLGSPGSLGSVGSPGVGEVVGRQDLTAVDFAVTREAETGSWLGLRHQGRGIGTEMRAAVLHLAFEGLGARSVTSAAMLDNVRSLGVSRRLGYRPDGTTVASVAGRRRTFQRLRLERAAWEKHRTVPVRVRGLDACRWFFLGPRAGHAAEPAPV